MNHHWIVGEDEGGRAVKKRLERLIPGVFRP